MTDAGAPPDPTGRGLSGAGSDKEGLDPADRSLARERTVLAWSRTGLSMLAAGAAALRVFPPFGAGGHHHAVGWALVALGALTWLAGLVLYRDDRVPTLEQRAWRLRGVALMTAAVAAASFVFALVPDQS